MSKLRYDPKTGKFRWEAKRPGPGNGVGTINSRGYLIISVSQKRYQAHRLAFFLMTGKMPDGDVDHINGNKTDNRWSNLRIATHSQNIANSQSKRDYKGVRLHAGGRYEARIKGAYLGLFDKPEQAQAAYITAAKQMFGAYARRG